MFNCDCFRVDIFSTIYLMQIHDLLNNIEFLVCTETESIADYLLKQGVISGEQYQDIINSKIHKIFVEKIDLLPKTALINYLFAKSNDGKNIF